MNIIKDIFKIKLKDGCVYFYFLNIQAIDSLRGMTLFKPYPFLVKYKNDHKLENKGLKVTHFEKKSWENSYIYVDLVITYTVPLSICQITQAISKDIYMDLKTDLVFFQTRALLKINKLYTLRYTS